MSGATDPPPISVALCTFNGERFLEAQLRTLAAQDHRDFEVVAVDDASHDSTWEILEAHARDDPRFRVLRNDRTLGVSRNFERAISLCRGDLIALCDQDDLWGPTHLSELAAALGGHSLIYCDSRLVDPEGRELRRMSASRNMLSGSRPLAFVFFNCVSGHALLFRREIFERARPFPENGYPDWWLAYVASVAGSIAYLDRCLVDYRQHGATVTAAPRLGARGVRPRGFRLEQYRQLAAWVDRLARLPGAPPRVERLARLVSGWEDRFLAWELAAAIVAWRRDLFAIPGHRTPHQLGRALNWLAGGRLRRWILPRRWRPE